MVEEQLIFDFKYNSDYSLDNFIQASCNLEALVTLNDNYGLWSNNYILLCGESGSGKSHLLCAVGSDNKDSVFLQKEDLQSIVKLQGIVSKYKVLFLEDIDRLLKLRDIEEDMLFHFLNMIREYDKYVIMSAKSSPNSWGLTLKDLQSRINVSSQIYIGQPDTTLLIQIFLKQMNDKGIDIEPRILDYLIERIPNSFSYIASLVEDINTYSIKYKKKLTISLLKMLLTRKK